MASRLPSLNALRAFEVTARHLSVTKAADELAVTQSAVSRHVRALEEELGVVLFRRLHRAISLSPEGEALARSLREGFNLMQRAVEKIRNRPGEVRIRVPPTLGTRWLLPRLHRFEQANPDVKVRISVLWDSMTAQDAEHDLGVIFNSERWPKESLRLLFDEHMAPVCSPAFLAAHGDRPPVELLRTASLLHCTGHKDWHEWLLNQGHPDIDSERGEIFDTMDMALRAAEGGRGIAMADIHMIADDLDLGRLVMPFKGYVTGFDTIYLVRRDAVRSRPEVARFADWIIAEAALTRADVAAMEAA